MTTITQTQYDSLVGLIYDTLMQPEDMGIGEMGICKDEAERVVEEWMEINNIKLK